MTSLVAAFCLKTSVFLLLTAHVGLLAWSATRHSPVVDEVGHLPAGLSHWHLNRFDLYSVNPPLIRCVATLPAFLRDEPIDFRGYEVLPQRRPEYVIGTGWIRTHPERLMPVYTVARWACLPFSVLGAAICFLWARDLYGHAAGLLSLSLWCFSPTVLGHASLMTPDAGATGVGVAACYAFWRWLNEPGGKTLVCAGILLGLTLLTKFTWLLLLALWPAWWIVWRWCAHRNGRPVQKNGTERQRNFSTADVTGTATMECRPDGRPPLAASQQETTAPTFRQLFLIFVLGWWVLNHGYLWEDAFQPLGKFQFFSAVLGGTDKEPNSNLGNRFHGTVLQNIPFPGPRNFLQGIDYIKFEYERGYPSYLRGEKKIS